MMKSGPRIRHTPEQWREILDKFRTSSLDRKAFCEQNGLRREALRRAELRLSEAPPVPMSFVEVAPPASAPKPAWDIELELGDGLVLRLARR